MSKGEFYFGEGPELGYFSHDQLTEHSLLQGMSESPQGRKTVASNLVSAIAHVSRSVECDDYESLMYTDDILGELEIGRAEGEEVSVNLDSLEQLVDEDRLIELAKVASETPGSPRVGVQAMELAASIVEEKREDVERRKHPDEMSSIFVYDKPVKVPWYCVARQCVRMCSKEFAKRQLGIGSPNEFSQTMLPGFTGTENGETPEQKSMVRNNISDKAKIVGPTACKNSCRLEELNKSNPEQLDLSQEM